MQVIDSTALSALRGMLVAGGVACAVACQPFAAPPSAPPSLDRDLVQRGGLLFVDPRLSGDASRACADCHPGGGTNGRAYLGSEEVGPGSPGARDVPSLRGAWQTPPYLWDGSSRRLRDAIQRMLQVEMRGAPPSEGDLVALESYVLSLAPFDRGRVDATGAPIEPATLRARRGFEVFLRAKCSLCHAAPAFARSLSADVGTGGTFNVPTLRGLASSAPYGHDGRFASIEEAVRTIVAARETELSELELEYLLEYLKLL